MSGKWRTRYLEIAGNRLGYSEAGEGPALVFVHGWSLDATCWRAQVDRFAREYRTLALDWRGTGASQGPVPSYRFDRLLDDLDEWIDRLGLERPILCGHSMGGVIALQYAAAHPAKVRALVIADAPGRGNLIINPLGSALLNVGLRLLGLVWPRASLRLLTPLFARLFYSPGFRRDRPEVIAAWRRQWVTNTPAGLLNSLAAVARVAKITPRVRALDLPTLFLVGAKDVLAPPRESRAYHHAVASSELVEIAGSGHMSLEEAPEAFNRLMADFFRARGMAAGEHAAPA